MPLLESLLNWDSWERVTENSIMCWPLPLRTSWKEDFKLLSQERWEVPLSTKPEYWLNKSTLLLESKPSIFHPLWSEFPLSTISKSHKSLSSELELLEEWREERTRVVMRTETRSENNFSYESVLTCYNEIYL